MKPIVGILPLFDEKKDSCRSSSSDHGMPAGSVRR